jgi:hypothetical protein
MITKAEYEKAEALVKHYRNTMWNREQRAKAKEGQQYVGRYFKIDASYHEESGDIEYKSYIKVLGCSAEIGKAGYDIILVEDTSDYGRGYRIQRLYWPFGMETPYFGKDREITKGYFETAMTYILGKMEVAPKRVGRTG